MTYSISRAALAGALALASSPAMAQDEEALRQELAEMRAMMAQMAQRIDALESELAETEAEATSAAAVADAAARSAETALAKADESASIAFKGMPEIKREGGWSFKPRGRLQFDAGNVGSPDSTGRVDGFGAEARRARLGASGDIPGGFGYKFEFDFAASELTVTDAIISYETGDVEILVGQFNTFQGLEELTSSLHTSFIERAAFTDVLPFERRVGVGAVYQSGDVLLQAGLFTDNMIDLPNKNRSVDARAVFMPKLGETQLHLGGSVHYNRLEDGATLRYRQRPGVHFSSDRFIDTGALAADGELGLGLEAAVISGPFHVSAETFWQTVDMTTAPIDPTFFGGSIEAGYFLTKGDRRGYKNGTFDRVLPANPVGEGGIGSVQVNVRYDRLDMNDAGIIGGIQDGYSASIVWKPTDYTMLLANYGHLEYTDAAFPAAGGDRQYNVDTFAVRAQIDF